MDKLKAKIREGFIVSLVSCESCDKREMEDM